MEITRHWRLKAQRYRLQGSLCSQCSRWTFPPRPVCPNCAAELSSRDWVLPVLPRSIHTSDIESPAPYENIERMIR